MNRALRSLRVQTVGLALLTLLAVSCARDVRRFPLRAPLWIDPDQHPLTHSPSEYYSGIVGDAADKLALYPIANALTFPQRGEAKNVNALDEVPNSSWFQNRVGMFDFSPEEAARAECGEVPELSPKGAKWTVISAKPDGANPGFFIQAEDGHRYLLKFDGKNQPLRASTADVIGSKLYWLLGYHSVCNEIVHFDPGILEMAPGATTKTDLGEKRPMTAEDVSRVLGKGFRLKDGRVRASASRFVPGEPIGPFKYQDLRGDDPNDVIPHEDRRELRAAHLPAAWINHVDAREQNTFDVLIGEGKNKSIRHYKIDWGDALGLGWEPDRLARRFGHSYTFDFEQIAEDLFTLGLLSRPWNGKERTKVHIFGYYGVKDFVPSAWRGVYSIPAFAKRTPKDVLWMTRILSRVTDAHIRAIVARAELPDPRQTRYLEETLIARRDRFFEEYLTQWVPLARFRLARRTAGSNVQSLCFEDLALRHRVADPNSTYYQLRFFGGEELDHELGWVQFTPDEHHPAWSCVVLPLGGQRPSELAPQGAPDDHPLRYGVMPLWVHQEATVLPMGQMKLHFYDLGPERGFVLVGVERASEVEVPDDY